MDYRQKHTTKKRLEMADNQIKLLSNEAIIFVVTYHLTSNGYIVTAMTQATEKINDRKNS